ncbi:MAG TPA: MFS transporter [Nitrospira sp.]|nr:MFS transporter [Nitrospira sp.]HMZ97622.1 MFS transporter [Nitrospira sp.]HNA47752.1 MFS transporter [Nitrospira sp.]HNJ21052.1 MFS transporter [Nitrospira sp.]HNK76456.1 MFS transporter [Nitrospira sp.]
MRRPLNGGTLGESRVGLDTSAVRPRWGILALLFAISAVTYMDRVNISVTARQMMPAYGLTDQDMGYVFSAFVFGYALCQIPGGRLGDRWGARVVLACALLWWSLCTVLTAVVATLPVAGLVGTVGALVIVRFLLGVGESVALPNFNRAVADWMPPGQRGLGIGIAIGGIGIGAAITPPLASWVMVNYHWQSVFYLSALIGLMVALLWVLFSRDGRSDATAKADTIPTPVPWGTIFRSRPLWWLVASYTCLGYVAYIYMSWFYLYLVNVRGIDLLRGGWLAAGPFLAILLFCPLGGWVTDKLVPTIGLRRARLSIGMLGMALAGGLIAVGAWVESQTLAIVCLSLGAGWLYFTVGAYWSVTTDLSKTHAGTLSGVMNTGANVGGVISPSLTPWLADHWGWTASLLVAAGIALCGGLMWMKVNPEDGLRE